MPKKIETKKIDYNIEYAHIYSNDFFGKNKNKALRNYTKLSKD